MSVVYQLLASQEELDFVCSNIIALEMANKAPN